MPLDIRTIPCLADNYAFLAHDPDTGDTALIDAPEAAPILAALAETGWKLTDVLITHHHYDHVDGLQNLLAQHPARVTGASADAHRLPALDAQVADGDMVTIGSETGTVIDVSGHTVGHIAFHFPASRAVFTADSLMALGCGRVFEGTKPQMHDSLQKLAALPGDTHVYSGHEYTTANGKFALTIDPENTDLISRIREVAEKRASGTPTVPSLLSEERATNPFLRAHDPAIQAHLGMKGADATDVFTEIRTRKDNF
ncbi:hydroxyacylglutathione hydrolase [uncultured Tateyamaria sp.]|uniref:hydroxyacylglutathione hydrolase n=1 Tax=uncultured Tateyamaria sp. TaxID=455651 RepID=UPI002612CCDE|nr:hydroxyacylglutathione hydrolase [uncultured Tateyamaria sp.]